MLNKDLRDWLRIELPDVVFKAGPAPDPNETDSYVIVTPAPGGGMTLEEQAEQPGFQIRAVGDQSVGDVDAALDSAEALAFRVDRAILTAFRPKIGGMQVVRQQRFGSGPTAIATDDADRAHVVCNYILEIASGY